MMSPTVIAIVFICIAISIALVMLFMHAVADSLSPTQIAFVSIVVAVIVMLFITLFLQLANTRWLIDRLDQRCMDCKSANFERFDPHSVHTFTVSTDVATTRRLAKSAESIEAAKKLAAAIGVPTSCNIEPLIWVVEASTHATDLARYVLDGKITTIALGGKICRIGVMDHSIMENILSVDSTRKIVFVLVDMSNCVSSPFNNDAVALSSMLATTIENAHVWAWATTTFKETQGNVKMNPNGKV